MTQVQDGVGSEWCPKFKKDFLSEPFLQFEFYLWQLWEKASHTDIVWRYWFSKQCLCSQTFVYEVHLKETFRNEMLNSGFRLLRFTIRFIILHSFIHFICPVKPNIASLLLLYRICLPKCSGAKPNKLPTLNFHFTCISYSTAS